MGPQHKGESCHLICQMRKWTQKEAEIFHVCSVSIVEASVGIQKMEVSHWRYLSLFPLSLSFKASMRLHHTLLALKG